MGLRMPSVLCGGHVVITVVDVLNDEVRITGFDHVVYVKRSKDEIYDDFVRRVIKYCEDEYARRSRGAPRWI